MLSTLLHRRNLGSRGTYDGPTVVTTTDIISSQIMISFRILLCTESKTTFQCVTYNFNQTWFEINGFFVSSS